MKSLIAMFLLIFTFASCEPKCDCVDCAEKCKVEATTETKVDSTAVAPVEEEAVPEVK